MKHLEGDYVLLSDIKDVDELNAVHDAVEVVGPTSYEGACYHAREYAKANPGDTYTVCKLCRVFRGRVEVDESEYGEGEA